MTTCTNKYLLKRIILLVATHYSHKFGTIIMFNSYHYRVILIHKARKSNELSL